MVIDIVNKSGFDLPKYETIGSAGMDLKACLERYDKKEDFKIDYEKLKNYVKKPLYSGTHKNGLWLQPGKTYIIPTGIFISLPKPHIDNNTYEGWGYEAQIRPRSGLSAKHGITVVNAPGTIDCDYIGEIKVILMNLSKIPHKINSGDRIAQMVINRYEKIKWIEKNTLKETERGANGFGSTGK